MFVVHEISLTSGPFWVLSDSRSSGERNGSSLNRENGVVGEQYKRRAARRSGGVPHPRWRESSSRKHH
ncbi:hypothetical protein L6164_007209 [Bauhinia variegata]|uniref:Uncharacterized protein n=1 Tax=Bauhinia variegata TaxID=167791 RepID=A0ACB9PIA9_BAUVA|nr:hypothetical protein L6164_007209 [Bauhinia variegata]